LANHSVSLLIRLKIGKKWSFIKASQQLSELTSGVYYLSWYEGSHKRYEPVGCDPVTVLAVFKKKQLELAYVAAGGEVKLPDNKKILESAYVAAGGEIKQPDNMKSLELAYIAAGGEVKLPNSEKILESAPIAAGGETNQNVSQTNSNGQKKKVSEAVKDYLEDCDDREGKSGYGLAVRTPESYEYRLSFLIEFKPEAYLDEVDVKYMKAFRRFLRKHKKKLGDRTCYNIMQGVSTFLLKDGNSAAKTILKEMSFPPTVVIPYSENEMKKFFKACNEKEELIFKFFLQSMARDMEVANCEVQDLKFDKNILHISPKPDRKFRLKGKRSGQAKNGRKVPIPTMFMARMKEYCKGKGQRDLLFTNGIGGIETHFLRRCKNIAKRAGLKNWEEFNLHRWRKTGATRHHEKGVSVRKIQAWLGHESLDVLRRFRGLTRVCFPKVTHLACNQDCN
jgi:integrase